MRTNPIGTGPFKFVEFKPNESIKLVTQPGLLEEGPALSRRHRIHDHPEPLDRDPRLRRRQVRHDLPDRGHDPAAEGREGAGAEGGLRARARPTSRTNLIVNRETRAVRQCRRCAARWRWRSTARPSSTSWPRARRDIGGAMLPPPEGVWGMPPEELTNAARLRRRRGEEPRRGAQDHGEASATGRTSG